MSTGRIGVAQGTAIYVGAILGAGLLALPALAAEVAGPASVLAWGLLLLLCVPVAATFAALGSRYPDGGGIATFVYKAFGRRASAVVGYWFYFAWPVGGPATAYVGGLYIADALGGGTRTAVDRLGPAAGRRLRHERARAAGVGPDPADPGRAAGGRCCWSPAWQRCAARTRTT